MCTEVSKIAVTLCAGVLVEVLWLAGKRIEEVALGDAVVWMDRLKTMGIGRR